VFSPVAGSRGHQLPTARASDDQSSGYQLDLLDPASVEAGVEYRVDAASHGVELGQRRAERPVHGAELAADVDRGRGRLDRPDVAVDHGGERRAHRERLDVEGHQVTPVELLAPVGGRVGHPLEQPAGIDGAALLVDRVHMDRGTIGHRLHQDRCVVGRVVADHIRVLDGGANRGGHGDGEQATATAANRRVERVIE